MEPSTHARSTQGQAFQRFVKKLSMVDATETGIENPKVQRMTCEESTADRALWRKRLAIAGALLLQLGQRLQRFVGALILAVVALMKNLEETELHPRACALRGPARGPSRERHPLRPPRVLARDQARRQAHAFGASPSSLYRQPHADRERFWWESQEFEFPPIGEDRWLQTSDGLLLRTHNKKRRGFHPRHRSCPVDLADLSSHKFTVFFPDDPTAICVDSCPRFIEQDDWKAGRPWRKDYRWRGFKVFVLRTALENSGPDQRPVQPMPRQQFENVIPAPKRRAVFRDGDLTQPREDPMQHQVPGVATSSGDQGNSQAASSSSFRGQHEAASVTINLTIVNNSGGTSSVEHGVQAAAVGSATDSDFEFVTP